MGLDNRLADRQPQAQTVQFRRIECLEQTIIRCLRQSRTGILHLDQNPNLTGLKLLITYARCPVPLVNAGDIPELLEADHEALVSYGIWRLRANEGGAELENAGELVNAFLDAAAARFEEVKSRSMAQGYDMPTAEGNPALRQNPLKRKWPKAA